MIRGKRTAMVASTNLVPLKATTPKSSRTTLVMASQIPTWNAILLGPMKSYENCQAHDRLKPNRYSFKCKLPPFPGCKSLLRAEGFLQNGILEHCTCHPGGDWHAGWGFRIPGISWCNNNFQLCFLSLSFLKNHRSTADQIVWQQKPTQKKTRPLQVFCTRRSCQTYQHLPMEERRGGRAPNPLKYSLVGQKKGFEIINTSKKQHQNLLLGHIADEWYDSQKYCLYTCITQGSLLKGIWFCPSESTLMQLLKPGGTLGLPWSCCPEHWHKSSDTNIPNAGQMNLKFRIMPLIFKKILKTLLVDYFL